MTQHIDTDVHCAPASIQTLFPYLDGYWRSYVEDAQLRLSPSAGNAYPPGAPTSATPAAREAGAFPPDNVELLREQVLDREGLDWALLNCTTSFDISRNPYYEIALTRAINDWIRTEWLDADERLRASMVVPTLDVGAAVAEIDRLGPDKRFAQVLLPVRGQDARYGNVRFRPLLAAAARHGLVVGLHAWGRISSSPTATGFTHTYLEDYVSNGQIVQAHVVSLIAEGVFSEIPDLRICLSECGFSWLPALLWRFDKEWRSVWREVPWVKEAPEKYLYRHFRSTTEPAQLPESAEEVSQLVEMMRAPEFLMHASDYPHDHGDGAARLLAALPGEARHSVLHGTAASFYRSR
ncbi:amidohydrolase family protein [Amycolatopsis alkalitolerans]|uniref:Amidohydrolase n=1 Tax=Amycolatopsis alkalitolerans TaxID=2547244 RepID=A0A5C4M5Q6_9PSEU|nr:amidohydrolase family protein [Amycolatopsis alkalitolerans]TNC26862.1 amidohydrolase [Amycolatopsis alkalitolerans]